MSVKSEEVAVAEQAVPGGAAERPQEIPPRGWLQVVKRGWAEAKADQVPLLAAGVAFYAFLALFPAMVAGVIMYGFIAGPATIATQVESVTEAMPADARQLIIEQLNTLSGQQRAGIGALVAVVLALWSASAGVANLMTAINTAYDEDETRSFVKKRGVALALTLGAIVFMVIMLALVAVVPAVLDAIGSGGPLRVLFQVLRWVVVAVVVTVALAILYRVASDRDRRRSAGCRSAPAPRLSCGSWRRSDSRSMCLSSGITRRRTALWPASSCCCSGSGSRLTRSCWVPRSTPRRSSRPWLTRQLGNLGRSATAMP